MKIFSSFDTNFKNNVLNEHKEKHWNENVHILEKSKFFLLKHIIIPFLVIILLSLLSWYITSIYLKTSETITTITIIFIFLLWILYASIIRKYIDYKMDYCIITPNEIILTEQTGLFNRWIRTLDAAKIKSISIQKKDVLNSLFNNWDIVFMSDWDDILWEIILTYIHNPEWQKTILHNIILK